MLVSRNAERFSRLCTGLLLAAAVFLQSTVLVLATIVILVIGCAWPASEPFTMIFNRLNRKRSATADYMSSEQVVFSNAFLILLMAIGLMLMSLTNSIIGWAVIMLTVAFSLFSAAGFCLGVILFALLKTISIKADTRSANP